MRVSVVVDIKEKECKVVFENECYIYSVTSPTKNFKDSKPEMAKLVDYLEMEVEGDRDGRGEGG